MQGARATSFFFCLFSCLFFFFLQRNQNKLVVIPRCVCVYVCTYVCECVLGAKKVIFAVAFLSLSLFLFYLKLSVIS